MADAWKAFAHLKAQSIDTGKVTSSDILGSPEQLKNNYLYRMAGAVLGIYGNSREEARYPSYGVDADGQLLDGSKHRYTVRFAPGQLPPANPFWSLTMTARGNNRPWSARTNHGFGFRVRLCSLINWPVELRRAKTG